MDNGNIRKAGEDDFDDFPPFMIKTLFSRLKIPSDRKIFKQAKKEHKSNFSSGTLPDVFYAADETEGQLSLSNVTCIIDLKQWIEEAQIPAYTFTGWFDAAVAEGALRKFSSINSLQSRVILPTDHALDSFIDPFYDNVLES